MNYTRLKLACYSANLSMSVVGNLSPVLFLTFRELYGISYSLLGLLVLMNFVTQLTIDLAFSFFSHRFNIPFCVKLMPWLTVLGLLIYAVWPFFFPDAVYVGLAIGTIIFAASGGLAEVLISPVIAAIPAKDPDREMSKLHSIYAWGVVGVIPIATLILHIFGQNSWQWLTLGCILIPFVSALLFACADIPNMETPEKASGALHLLKNKGVWMCVAAIFFGGAAECTMAQWSSGYLERALGIPKMWGDIFGVSLFALMLGLGRTLYAKYGKNIGRVLTLCGAGAVLCYLCAAISPVPIVGLISCALCGLCTSMLWPGNLIVAADRFPAGGVFIYAMMAAGGDLGASIVPQLLGIVTDVSMTIPAVEKLAASLSLAPDQMGMKLGMLIGMLFPLVGTCIYRHIWKTQKERVPHET